MGKIVSRFALLLAAASLRPMCALALECDVMGADSCGSINRASHYQRLDRPTGSDQASFVRIADKNPIGPGCNTEFRSVRCDETTDLIRTHSVLLEGAPVVRSDGVRHRQFRSDIKQRAGSFLSPHTMQLPGADGMRYDHPGRQLGRLYDSDTAAVAESWANLAYRFSSDIGPSSIWSSLPDALIGSFQEIHRYSLFGVQLVDSDGHDDWFLPRATDSVPEPGRLATLIAGLFGIYAVARRRISSI